jgi:hypothetical protein
MAEDFTDGPVDSNMALDHQHVQLIQIVALHDTHSQKV